MTNAPDFKVLAQQGEWTRIVRADGWVGWVPTASAAGGVLDTAAMGTPVPVAATASPAATGAGGWAATHLVPEGGLGAWTTPDPTQPATATLGGGLDVRVLQRADDWAFVECSNGWTAWTDGRWLVTIPAAAPVWTTPRAPSTPASLLKAHAAALVGAVLVVVATFLPWIGASGPYGGTSSAWDLPIGFLTSNTPKPSDIDLAWTALVVLALVIPLLLRRAVPKVVLGIVGFVTLAVPADIVFRAVSNDGYGPRVGAYLALAGGLVITAASTFALPDRG